MSRWDMPLHLNGKRHGGRAFRRALGTRWPRVDAVTVQHILRHSRVTTTQAYYIQPTPERTKAGLKKFCCHYEAQVQWQVIVRP